MSNSVPPSLSILSGLLHLKLNIRKKYSYSLIPFYSKNGIVEEAHWFDCELTPLRKARLLKDSCEESKEPAAIKKTLKTSAKKPPKPSAKKSPEVKRDSAYLI